MARPKNPDTPPAPTLQDTDVSDIDPSRSESPELAKAIESASAALDQKAEALAKLGVARRYAHDSMALGIGSPEQVQWIRFYLPKKSRATVDAGE